MSQLSQSKKSEWFNHIKAQRESGLSQVAYCQEHDLKSHQFWYWKRQAEGSTGSSGKPRRQAKQSGFVPVSVVPTSPSQGLSITLVNGVRISGIVEGNQQLAKQLIGAL